MVNNKKYIPGVRIQNAIYKFPFIRFLSENSYFYSLLFNTVWDYFKSVVYKKRKGDLITEYAIPVGKVNDYQTELEIKLLERMYDFCNSKDIKLIILDIPNFGIQSFPQQVYDAAKNNCDLFINGAQILNEYRDIADINVPHGQQCQWSFKSEPFMVVKSEPLFL
jgi:hypothetical protein